MTPTNGQQDSPPDGFRSTDAETDSDRRLLSLATISEWMGDMGKRVVRIEERLGHVGSALATVAQAIGEVRSEQREAKEREAALEGRLIAEFSRLHRQDSIHDDAITKTDLKVAKAESTLTKVAAQITWPRVAVGAATALAVKLLDVLINLPAILKALGH